MDSPVSPPRLRGLKYTLVAGLTLLTTDALFAQSAGQSDVDALKAQMNQMQRQYEQRIEAMEAKMKTLESNANSGSILNTRVLTDADGKEMPGKAPAPMLDESFLKSLTRNFTFNVYMRAGTGFNGNGGAMNFNFEVPDNPGGRFRLGNENDFYTELSFNQAHILGDSPDVADVSFRATPNLFTNGIFHTSFETSGNTGTPADFRVGIREGYVEMKNVIKSAPEITFWGGQRFYDRYNFDPNDWFWLDTSGFGIGAYNINLGPGNLYIAWIADNHDNLDLVNNATQFNSIGDQLQQTIDIRYKNIDIGFGKLSFVAIGNYAKGGVVTGTGAGATTTFTDVLGIKDTINVTSSDAYGIGGGLIYQYDFGNKSYFRLFSLWGYGLTNFGADNLGNSVGAFETNVNNFRLLRPASNVKETGINTFTGGANPYPNSQDFRSGYEFVWNPSQCFAMDFWGYWDHSNQGFQMVGTNAEGEIKNAHQTRNLYGVGFRPVYWFSDNFAIQGQAGYNYVDQVRGYSGTNAFGRAGSFGIFTIAPTIKPKGGYFTRPELRLFATYSIWSSSLKGTTTPIGEGGNTSGAAPPYNHNQNQGWLFGSQMEIWF
jgi:maltoporin